LHVLFAVLHISLPVFKNIFDHRYSNDKRERQEQDRLSIGVRDRGDQLKQSQQQEVGIRHLSELLEQVLGQESEAAVFGGADFVRLETAGSVFLREHLVHFKHSTLRFPRLGTAIRCVRLRPVLLFFRRNPEMLFGVVGGVGVHAHLIVFFWSVFRVGFLYNLIVHFLGVEQGLSLLVISLSTSHQFNLTKDSK